MDPDVDNTDSLILLILSTSFFFLYRLPEQEIDAMENAGQRKPSAQTTATELFRQSCQNTEGGSDDHSAKIFVAVLKVYCCRDFLFNSRYVFPFKIARRGSYKHLSGTRRTQADV